MSELTVTSEIASRGYACGRVIHVSSPLFPLDQLQPQSIVMAERTAPWLIAYILDAAGLVLIRGGVLSHAAAMCRELGIPCLVGIAESFAARLPNAVVELNANQGYLRILET